MKRYTLGRILLAACLALAGASLFGSGARAVTPSPDLNATIDSAVSLDSASPATDSIAGGTTFTGNLFWNLGLDNPQSSDPVSTPAISVTSGYDPSLFFANGPSFPTSSFPFTAAQPSLGPQSGFRISLGSSLTASGQVGCDTSRSMSPTIVPPGGTQQTITFTIRCTDPTVDSVNGGMDLFPPCDNLDALCPTNPASFTFISVIPPANLDHGEQWNDFTDDQFVPEHFGYNLANLVTGKQYTIALVVQTPNPYPVPITWTPFMGLSVYASQPSSCSGCGVPASSLTVPVPSLDGPTPNAGAVTFSTGEPSIWNLDVRSQRNIGYGGTSGGGLYYAGPESAAAGQQVTLSATWDPQGNSGAGTPVTFTLGSQSCTGATINGGTPDARVSCTMTLSQPVGSYTLKMFTPGDVSVYPESASAPFSISAPTPAELCALTRQDVDASAKYQQLRPAAQKATDLLVTSACQILTNIGPTLKPAAKTKFIAAYQASVRSLAAHGWVTGAQADLLVFLAGQL